MLPHNMLTQNGFQVGSLCEMVLLSLALASRVNEMQQQSRTDSLLVADIDHFKEFNDKHGHDRGDEVLRTVARQLREGVRSRDIVCRYGGEEFALILPGMDGTQAMELAESLRKTVEDAGLSDGRITISIGVASPNDQAIHTVGKLFRAADTALYQDKAEGRNRVVRFAG